MFIFHYYLVIYLYLILKKIVFWIYFIVYLIKQQQHIHFKLNQLFFHYLHLIFLHIFHKKNLKDNKLFYLFLKILLQIGVNKLKFVFFFRRNIFFKKI